MKIPKPLLRAMSVEGPFLLASHIDPDGDAIGSVLGLGLGLEAAGKKVLLYNRDPVPSYFRFLPGSRRIRHNLPPMLKHDPVLILLDCNTPDRSGVGDTRFRQSIVIDHHETESSFGNVRWILPDAASAGIMVYYLLKELGIPITTPIATNLYTSIAVDTGTFRYSNTSADVLRVAASLIEAGARADLIAERLYESWEFNRFQLLTMVLQTLKVKGPVAVTHVTREMYRRTGTSAEDTENFSNFPRTIRPIRISVFLRELEDGAWKVSLRSKGRVNVARIAERFGGGGHQNAAGFKTRADLASAVRAILKEAEKVL